MQAQTATVVKLDSAHLTLEVEAPVGCARCAAGKGCGAGLIGASGQKTRQIVLPIPATPALACGDRVSLTLRNGRLAQAAMLIYGLPLAGMLLVLLLADLLSGGLGEMAAIALAATGLAAGALAGRRLTRRERSFEKLLPEIAERLPARGVGAAASSA